MKHSEDAKLEDRVGWVYICDTCRGDVVVSDRDNELRAVCRMCGKTFGEEEIDPLVLKESPELLDHFRRCSKIGHYLVDAHYELYPDIVYADLTPHQHERIMVAAEASWGTDPLIFERKARCFVCWAEAPTVDSQPICGHGLMVGYEVH